VISRRRFLAGAITGVTLLMVPREVLTPARPASATTTPAPLATSGAAGITSGPSDDVIVEKITYRGETATVYRPQVTSAHPVAYFLHGGFWERGSRHQYDGEARIWAQRGWVAVTLDYSLGTGYQAQVDDVWAGISTAEAQWYADPQRQILFGDSAGGHLAALVAVEHPDHFRGQILWSPVISLLNAYRDRADPVNGRRLLGQAAQRVAGQDWAGSDPSLHVTAQTPPAWIAGSTDEFVDFQKQGQVLADAMGPRAEVHLINGNRHGKSLQQGPLARSARAWARDQIS